LSRPAPSPEENTIICRCEDISQAEIRRMIAAGYATPDEIKRLTRAGMGLCQGKTCRHLLAQEISRATGRPVSEINTGTHRPPTKPFRVGLLVEDGAEGADGAEGGRGR
jgi:bacterioferritin-associated ferredoxin